MDIVEILRLLDAAANVVLTVAGPVLALLLGKWVRANVDDRHRQDLRVVAGGIYWAVERFGRTGELKSADKLAKALRLLDDELGRPATEAERRQAVGVWRAKAEKHKPAPRRPRVTSE